MADADVPGTLRAVEHASSAAKDWGIGHTSVRTWLAQASSRKGLQIAHSEIQYKTAPSPLNTADEQARRCLPSETRNACRVSLLSSCYDMGLMVRTIYRINAYSYLLPEPNGRPGLSQSPAMETPSIAP